MNTKSIIAPLFSLLIWSNCAGMLRTSSPDYGAIKHANEEKKGKLYAVVGPMCCGKSEEVMRIIRVLTEHALLKVLVCKPEIDTRAGHLITSRAMRESMQARTFTDPEQIFGFLKEDPSDFVVCDEVQFASKKMIAVVNKLLEQHLQVVVAGLETDFKREPFGECIATLLAIADDVTKLKAVCSKCKQWDATLTQRLIDGKPAHKNSPLVMIDDGKQHNVVYEPRCRNCHELPE